MDGIQTLDARGLSCPEPAMLARQALERIGSGTLIVLVDSAASRDNVSRIGRQAGWAVTVQPEADSSYRLLLQK